MQSFFKKAAEEANKLNLNLVNTSFLFGSLRQIFLSIIQSQFNYFYGSVTSQEPNLTTVTKAGSYVKLCGE